MVWKESQIYQSEKKDWHGPQSCNFEYEMFGEPKTSSPRLFINGEFTHWCLGGSLHFTIKFDMSRPLNTPCEELSYRILVWKTSIENDSWKPHQKSWAPCNDGHSTLTPFEHYGSSAPNHINSKIWIITAKSLLKVAQQGKGSTNNCCLEICAQEQQFSTFSSKVE